MSQFFKTPDGRLLSSNLVEAATPVLGTTRWKLTLRRNFPPVEVESVEFLREQLIKAGKTEYAIGPDGTRRRVLFWRLRHGETLAEPVLGLVIAEPPPIDGAKIFGRE